MASPIRISTFVTSMVLLLSCWIAVRRPYFLPYYKPTAASDEDNFVIYTETYQGSQPLLKYLDNYSTQIGNDMDGYRSHNLKLLTFSMYFLRQEKVITDKETTIWEDFISLILVYHDIALWSDGQLDYLEPSWERLRQDFNDGRHLQNKINLSRYDKISPREELIQISRESILQHHKITPWHSPSSNQLVEHVVNAIRQADWMDVTHGLLTFGLPINKIGQVFDAIPENNFHLILAGMGRRLSPNSILGQLKPLKIFKL